MRRNHLFAVVLRPQSYLKYITGLLTAVIVVGLGGLFNVGLAAGSATLYLTPSSGSYSVGQTLTVSVYTNTSGDTTNAVEADFSYSSSTLQFQSIDTSGSAF